MTKRTVLAVALGAALFGFSAWQGQPYESAHRYADPAIVPAHASGHHHYFDDDECGGAVSCTSEFVGDVIALPFRAVASLVDFIF